MSKPDFEKPPVGVSCEGGQAAMEESAIMRHRLCEEEDRQVYKCFKQ